MRRLIGYAVLPAIAALILVTTPPAWGFPSMAMETNASCATCHSNPAGGADLTEVGKAYQKDPSTAVKSVEGSEYVGAKKCKICHMKYHTSWATTAHAKALENLAKADAKVVAEVATKLDVKIAGSADKTDGCIKCHVTGLHLAGGYPGTEETKAELSFVGCESCHGPGSKHVKAAKEDRPKTINKNVTAAMCMDCHTKVMSPKFDFDAYVAKGVHKIATE